jgi:carboxyl-terminal processing protease
VYFISKLLSKESSRVIRNQLRASSNTTIIWLLFMRKHRPVFWPLIALTLALLLNAVGFSQDSTLALRQETFETVWRRVKERHYDPNLNGVDWDAVHKQYAPRVAAVKTDDELYQLLNQLLGELKQSHFQVIPPSAYIEEEEGRGASRDGEVGMLVQLVEGRPTIVQVEPESPAAQSGLRPGFVLTHIDDRSADELQRRIAARKERPVRERFLLMRVVSGRLSGPIDSTVTVRYLDERDQPRTATLRRRKPDGEPVKFGELPTLYAEIETKRLAQGIGYVRFNVFMVPLLAKIREAVKSLQDAPGIILDLRNNPGGVGIMATGVAGLFYQEKSLLGTMKMRQGETRFVIYPVQEHSPYSGPLMVLTDEGTGSTSEILAGGVQEDGRATIVGGPSAGAVLPSVFEKLPIGARLQYAFADFKTAKGVLLEGRGVLPDVPVELTRRALLDGHDPVLDKAVALILEKMKRES